MVLLKMHARPEIMKTLEIHVSCCTPRTSRTKQFGWIVSVKLVLCNASAVSYVHPFLERVVRKVRNFDFLSLSNEYMVNSNKVVSAVRGARFGFSGIGTQQTLANKGLFVVHHALARVMIYSGVGHWQLRQTRFFDFF